MLTIINISSTSGGYWKPPYRQWKTIAGVLPRTCTMIGATLSLTNMNINHIKKNLKQGLPSDEPTNKANELINKTMADIRRISKDLLPPILEKFGLADALDELCITINASSAIKADFQHNFNNQRLEEQKELLLYRIAQEITNNAIKHANATLIEIELNRQNDHLQMTVSDNGKGFDLQEIEKRPHEQRGLGLKNIESRINMLNATIKYDSAKGKGTRVTVEMKLQ
ncbi:MAG: ATP-binding protein [Bacteroidota bacterium]